MKSDYPYMSNVNNNIKLFSLGMIIVSKDIKKKTWTKSCP